MGQPVAESAAEILAYIKNYFDKNYLSPTYREIKNALKISTTSLLDYRLKHLIETGQLEKEDGKARCLRIPGWTPNNEIPIHLKGYIAASNDNPSMVFDEFDAESLIEVPRSLIPKNTPTKDIFAVTVQGDSMEDALIGDGDIVILKHTEIWTNGDTVAVWLINDDALTLKELYQKPGQKVELRPRSQRHKVRVENQSDIIVQGKLIGVYRQYRSH